MNPTSSIAADMEQFVPLVEELPARLDPFEVLRSLASLPHAALFDSAMRHPHLGRYSYVTADPFEWLTARGHDQADPLSWLRHQLARYAVPSIPDLPPFQGGAVTLFGYDLCHYFERLPRHAIDDFQTPDVAVGLYDWVIAFDHVHERNWLISTGWPAATASLRRQRAAERLDDVRQRLAGMATVAPAFDLGTPPPALAPIFKLAGTPTAVFSNFERDAYLAAVRKAIHYIHAGDCFQVNIAQRLLCEPRLSPLDLYEKLRTRNPAPFAAYFDLGEFVIASASPERFLRIENGEVETRPIKGTRPRGQTPEDERLRQRSCSTAAQGSCRERDDRRPDAQRPWPRVRLRLDPGAGTLPIGII